MLFFMVGSCIISLSICITVMNDFLHGRSLYYITNNIYHDLECYSSWKLVVSYLYQYISRS